MKTPVLVTTLDRLQDFVDDVAPEHTLYYDIESTGFDERKCKLVMLQFGREGHKPVVVDWRQFINDDTVKQAVAILKPLFRANLFVGHNLNHDFRFSAAAGLRMQRMFDTMLAEQLIHSVGIDNKTNPVNLAAVLERRFGIEMSKDEREWFYLPAPLDERPEWFEPLPDEQVEYGANDVDCLPQLMEAQLADLKRLGMLKVAKLEMRALPAIASMSMVGIKVNMAGWREMIAEWAEQAAELESRVIELFGPAVLQHRARLYDEAMVEYEGWAQQRDEYLALLKQEWADCQCEVETAPWGKYKTQHMQVWREATPNPGKPKLDSGPPNLGSWQQLLAAFAVLGIPAESTKEEALLPLRDKHPEIATYLDWKVLNKASRDFGETLLAFADDEQRIHPDWLQIGAETGRMACRKPNWQQIPSKRAAAKLRQNVIPADGCKLLVADFKNIELYVLANLSKDKNMVAMFERGEDMHSFTARQMFGVPEDVDPDKFEVQPGVSARKVAKTINFGTAYGQSEFGFAKKIGVSKEVAKEFQAKWYGLYSGAKGWLDGAAEDSLTDGYSKTVLGRRRFYGVMPPCPKVKWSDEWKAWQKRAGAIRRAGMNHPMQGTSADMSKLALALFYERCPRQDGRLVGVVHDELLVEAKTERADVVADLLADCMYEACCSMLTLLPSPKPNVSIGDYWTK